ncbi:hypothetical protein HPB51_012053 [Rhipicephalus microplus]|uniref:Uncharacterized protein n=1 Tax=Rhipicephalus microplus TaxID=6941 RepID=A0A9J6F1V5_RHIMP|nr:hypothetical protein HPB51_012053 [Rhipicephalus microplus]
MGTGNGVAAETRKIYVKVKNLVVVGTKDDCVLQVFSLEHLRLTDKTINVQAYLKATVNMGKGVIPLVNTFTTDYIFANTTSPDNQIIGARRLGSTNVVTPIFEHSNIPRYHQPATAKPLVQQAGQARDHSRKRSGDYKAQQKSSNVTGNDTSARSSRPRFKKRAASRSKSRSRARGPQSTQKHTKHDKTSTAPSPVKLTGAQMVTLFHMVWDCQNNPSISDNQNPALVEWEATLSSSDPVQQQALIDQARMAARANGLPY